mgnify:CR=1 FL=1
MVAGEMVYRITQSSMRKKEWNQKFQFTGPLLHRVIKCMDTHIPWLFTHTQTHRQTQTHTDRHTQTHTDTHTHTHTDLG